MDWYEYKAEQMKKRNKKTKDKVSNGGVMDWDEYLSTQGVVYNPENNSTTEDRSGLFKKSEGNALQTIGGTLADLGISVGKGALGGVEDTFDSVRYGYADILDVLGRDERADYWRAEAMQNDIDDAFAPIKDKVEKYSVSGDVLDDISGAVGYIAALKGVGKLGQMAGLGEKGVGNLVKGAMFTSAMGGGMTEAYRGNATDKEALTYGALTGTTAVVIEGLVGGLGKSLKVKGFSDGKVDKYISKFADMVTKNTTLKNTITTVSGALGEGVEEVAEGFANAFAKKFTYMSEEDIWDIMKDEKFGEQFLIGTLASAVSQMPSYVSANKSGVDIETGYTKNEQQLHDAILKEKLDAVEGELTKQERAEIEERVKTDIKKGNIDIDTIEKVLGGDTYKGYESVLAEMNEFNTLNKTKSGELTGEQADRLAKLKENNEKYAYQERVDALKRHLSKEVYEKTQNDAYIVESYNENAKKGQALELDMSKYDEEHQKAIKILTENVKLNNTKKTHDMVETLSNIAVDRKLTFKCADAETMNQLAQNDGVIRNAYINGDEITFNPSSKKAINSLTVHEVLHDIKKKNPKMYRKLEKALIDFASSKGIYESKMQNIKETYKKIKGKDIDDALANEELAALLAEDYIATNEEFVKNLSTKKPNIFRRIYEEIKHLCKLATSGSEIHRNLEKARRMYEKAYREGKKTNINNDTRYSVSTEYTSYPKTKTTVSPTEAGLQDNVKTVREVRAETMLKNKYTQEDVEQINKFMDNMATFMEEAGVTYKFIGLDDVNNAKLKVAYDKKGNPKRVTMSAMVKNGDYPINFDFTSICKKRQSMSMVVKELANRQNNGKRALDTINLDTKALWTINEELRKAGLETACLGCFVESKRYNIQKFADKATNMWNSIVDEVRKEQGKTEPVESFNFAEGINIDDVDYNEVEGIFKNYSKEDGRKNPEGRMRALIKNGGEMFQKYLQPSDLMTPEGIEGMKSMSSKKNNFYGIIQGVYGTVAPKEVMGFTPYNSEIAMLPATKRVNGKSKSIAEYIASIGGVRMQSFSDFIVANVYDYMQMVADLSARHLPAHAYTKEIAFAKMFGLTGMKINMSVMFDIDANLPDEWAGLKFVPDKNGTKEYNGIKGRLEYLVADKKRSDSVYEETGERPYVQSIGYDEAVELQNTEGYSKNVGIVAVGFSDEHIFMMLDDDNIRYIIPYHASNMPADIKEVTNIKKAKNYTDYQNTRNAKGEALKGLGGFDIYKDVEQTKNPKETANNYLKYCKEKGYTPMFEDFSSHDNYYKLLFDFDVYDTITGEYSPQTEVKNVYKGYNPEDGQYSTDELENLIDEEMKVQNEANEHRNEIISGVVDNVMKQLGIESETVKLVDDDTMYSLSEDSEGTENGWRVYFDDILLKDTNSQEDIAPVRDSIPYQNNKIGVLSEEDELDISITDKLAEIERIRDNEQIAEVLDTVPDKKSKSRIAAIIKANVLDKGLVFENLALKTKGKDGKYNRELEAKYDYIMYSPARAQEYMLSGAEGVKSLNDIIAEVENTDHKKDFYQYMYHKHNIDRMSLRDRYKDKNGNPMNNKPVFGDAVTSKMSKEIVDEYEKLYPEFKDFAQDVYDYMTHLRNLMVESGIITKQAAKLWSEMYPYYVPINRGVENGLKSDLDLVGIDTTKEDGTSVNAPIKKATGGSSNILPLFETMASRTMQTYKAIAKNNFGVELKNALGTVISDENAEVDDVIDSIDSQDGLLQEGKNGKNPTFTIFENGKRVTFEVTKDMYDALKPLSESSILNKPIPVVNQISNIRRGLITEFNPAFMLTNPIKDVQDVLLNSQHPLKTYKKLPEAFAQIKKKGYWYDEYIKNGGSQNTIFDNEKGTFKTSNKGIARMLEVPPLSTISKINQTIEMLPRLAEYIASREDGASVEVAMLDAARVTTNFKAGGNVTKFLNRNGCTFLNASVQGFMQQIRNFREAKANGVKGYMNLATKFAIAGLPVFLLNHLIWDDDEEYEELSDYIKQNYYVVWKDDNGQFVRVPKGRMLAVIQDGFAQMENLITGNDEVDLDSFLSLVANNVAPTNPADNNILAPINQVRKNETWYGEDLVPTRLQDFPDAEQYDESTDTLSKWLGEKLDISPVKINYLIDQYSGAIGDVFLPMMTPEAESGNDSFGGELIAPIKDKFTADAIMDNQNISDFYDKSDELTKNANSSKATDEDKLKSKYFSSMQSQISALYKQKREIQNSNLKDSKKYKEVRQIQEEIIGLCKEAMENYSNVTIDGNYATVGGVSYRNDNGNWTKVNDDQMSKQQEAMDKFGISGSEYWDNKDEYSYAVDNPEKYLVSQAIADFDDYSKYKKDISKIEADKDENGKSINGSRKEKVIDYINNLDIDRGAKKILIKMNYPSEDKYNEDIVEYLSDRDDISYDEMKTILKELGFTVKSDGTVTW